MWKGGNSQLMMRMKRMMANGLRTLGSEKTKYWNYNIICWTVEE